MDNDQTKALCLNLIKADKGEDIIELLQKAGYWDDDKVWRYYSDYENNYNVIGNQQSSPDAALVEKLVNSVDACLMNKCLLKKINPEGPSAPKSIKEAVAQFYEENPNQTSAGHIRNWDNLKRTKVSRDITLAATGDREGNPSFTISDCGEGQTPEMMPKTFLSTQDKNKLRIPFVQGKFNMGGTGALIFCGSHKLQLIVTRRNPAMLDNNKQHDTDDMWGFTIVRREKPEGTTRRSSIFSYLAPIGANQNPGKGGVLRFGAKSLPIFPEKNKPYERYSEWGTLVKVYDYSVAGYRTHILRRSGIMERIDLLLPDVALPIRLHECRSHHRGHSGSFDTTLSGLSVRLDDDKANNLEFGFPDSSQINVSGEPMTVKIYAFKKDKSKTYRRDEGIIFTVNGQTHGYLTKDFFRRGNIGLGYLADSIFVIVDCSNVGGSAREDLFMNSRDRLRKCELRGKIVRNLEDLLKHHIRLRELKDKRRREVIESKLEDSKPLVDILANMLKSSPTLAQLFGKGNRISSPFKKKSGKEDKIYQGKKHPSYFRFKNKRYGHVLKRDCHLNTKTRIFFETDVENEYLARYDLKGEFSLYIVANDHCSKTSDEKIHLQDGYATLTQYCPVKI
ncbi:MAG: hypothetical protein KJI69_06260 [Patescibacteria group bacterium]|nr:hypothetical protein [Patescibacteria group bacterium]